MKYHWRAFLWENGSKSTEYTDKLAMPIFIEDRLDETMDGGQITLENMPIASRNAFPPKTKFRLERYVTADFSDTPRKWDLVVEHDDVEEYAGLPEFCCHRVHLIEASVITQGMHVDNIALTYELQDVSLNYRTVGSNTDTLGDLNAVIVAGNGHPSPTHSNPPMPWAGVVTFSNSYRYVWSGQNTIQSLLYEQDARTSHTVNFTIPTLTAQGAENGVWTDICEARTRTLVIKRHFRDSILLSETTVFTRDCGPTILPRNVTNSLFSSNVGDWMGGVPPDAPMIVWATGISGFSGRDEGLLISPNDLIVIGSDPPRPAQFSNNLNSRTFVEISREMPGGENKSASFDTSVLSETQLEAKERYTYEIRCVALQANLPTHYYNDCEVWETTGPAALNNSTSGRQGSLGNFNGVFTNVAGSTINIIATMRFIDMATDAVGSDFLVRARKYNCYDLLRKALLTCDTQIFDNAQTGLEEIHYPIIIDDMWAARLSGQTMYETIFEQKNLWEVLLQLGQYLHAIPYLEYADDDTDRFVLKFRQLGATEIKENSSTKITIFNSKNLSEFFTQYDSYVSNLFSPQNVVNEWIVPKTSDSSFLISNNTAELHTKYPMQEILEFNITYNGVMRPALEYIFEKSIYSILTPVTNVRPSKASSLYYSLGDNKILGLNYTPPSVNNDALFALKNIMSSVFGINAAKIRFNNIRFHVKYRTQDTLRVSMVRPDIHNFAKNSSLESYPHHNQYFGQQEKIVDSERFSANLWGRLIRVANNVHQLQEYAENNNEKESGDLVLINDEPYYVTAIDNEYYPDVILQKVTCSKNFNQLSNIVTIPSEPRFYEVSERSQVRREVMLMDFLMLASSQPSQAIATRFLNAAKWRAFIKWLVFKDGTDPGMPNYAYTRFKADERRQHIGSYGQVLPIGELFPSVEVAINPDSNAVVPKPSSSYRDVIVPIMHSPLKNAITFTWDMDDNFKAGDSVDVSSPGNDSDDTADDAYYSQQAVRYCDVMGRADLFSFKLFNKTSWTQGQEQRLPFAEGTDFSPTDEQSLVLIPNNLSVGLDKDNREAVSFNYQINLLQESNRFITFPNLFGEKSGRLKMCVLNKEVSMFDEIVNISNATIIADNVSFQLLDNGLNAIELRITQPAGVDLADVKSIIIYDEEGYSKYASIAKNVANLANGNKLQSWWISPTFN